jgi:hypothetical protein
MASQEPHSKKVRSTEGREEAKAAATMTKEEWNKHQEGMADKWPAPEYMKVPSKDTTRHTRDETYHIVTRWMKDTKISYRPHAKAPGSKSHIRYEQYSQATTVGEALNCGTLPADWCWDYERGFIKVHGPVRDEPIDVTKVTEDVELTEVDRTISRWFLKELVKNLDLNPEDLSNVGHDETTIMRAHRLVAQRVASSRLAEAEAEGRRIRDEDIVATLREWAFAKNTSRINVMREGQDWVWSDTMGALIDRTGDLHVTSATLRYPAVPRIIAKWLRDRSTPEMAGFGWTSLNLNCNYAAALHRDKNNFGPSMIKGFGDFQGGELCYFPEDDKKVQLELLPDNQKVCLQIRDGLAMFNGNCGHYVQDFKGERFSVVYFTLGCHAKLSAKVRGQLEEIGFVPPAANADRHSLLRAPRGYGSDAACAHGDQLPPAVRFWSNSELEAHRFVAPLLPALPEPETSRTVRQPKAVTETEDLARAKVQPQPQVAQKAQPKAKAKAEAKVKSEAAKKVVTPEKRAQIGSTEEESSPKAVEAEWTEEKLPAKRRKLENNENEPPGSTSTANVDLSSGKKDRGIHESLRDGDGFAGMALKEWCSSFNLPMELMQRLEDEEVSCPADLAYVPEEDLRMLVDGFKIGPKGRFLAAVQILKLECK